VPDSEALEKPLDPGQVISWVQLAVERLSHS
jgi:hypothetical protein